MAAADEEECGSQFAPCLEEPGAFLDETAKGRDACAGGDHEKWGAIHFGGEVEGRVRGFNLETDVVARLQFEEGFGADADKAFASALESFLFQNSEG